MVDAKMKALAVLRKDIESGAVDVPRELLKAVAERLMSAEADAACGASYGERSEDRVNRRNGYRQRQWDTRVGTVDLGVPRLRSGSYFPQWLLEPRRRAERALTQVVAESYVLGVSTRRVDKLVQSMGIDGISKSEVSRLAEDLDELVEQFRSRPLDAGPYTYLWLDAHTQRCREGGRIVNVATVVAIGVNADGHREVLGVDVITTDDGTGWTAFLRSLKARGLSGVRLVVSDAHEGLKDAIGAVLPGASWQRRRTHFMRNLLTRVPKSSQQIVATLVRSIFSQTASDATWEQERRVVEQFETTFPNAARMLDEASGDVLAYASLPREHWKQLSSNNPLERLNKELRRRTDVVGIFPNREAVIRLVGAVLAEQHDEWAVARGYMSPELLARARLNLIDGARDEEDNEAVSALDAAC